MSTSRKLKLLGAFAASSFLATGLLVACGSDDSNPEPSTPVYTLDGGGTNVDATTPPGADAGPGLDTGIADTGPLPDVDAAGCTGDGGCWSTETLGCVPTTTAQFLNQCAPGTTCTPFDNSKVPNYDGGILVWQ